MQRPERVPDHFHPAFKFRLDGDIHSVGEEGRDVVLMRGAGDDGEGWIGEAGVIMIRGIVIYYA